MANDPKSIRIKPYTQEIIDICLSRYGMTFADFVQYAVRRTAEADNIILPGPLDSKPIQVMEVPA